MCSTLFSKIGALFLCCMALGLPFEYYYYGSSNWHGRFSRDVSISDEFTWLSFWFDT